MGSGGGGKSTTYNAANTYESPLSRAQLEILKLRQQQYQQYFFPEIVKGVQQNSAGTQEFSNQLAANTAQVNAAFDQNRGKIRQNLAQQGMLGQGNGVQAALNQANERARSSALASAYSQQLASADSSRQQYLSLAAGMSPTATTSADYLQSQKAQSGSWNVSGSIL